MQLGKFTDYGLRVLVHLAVAAPNRVSVAQIAKTFQISDHHLAKVCSRLVKGGLLLSERGRSGGLSLAKPAKQIRLGDAIRCLSDDQALVECFASEACDCIILTACGLRKPLADARAAFLATLDNYSLTDVTGPHQNTLQSLLLPLSP